MRICSHCDHEMEDTDICCPHCGSEQLSAPAETAEATASLPESVRLASPPLVDLAAIPEAFRFAEGFSRPDWMIIHRTIEQSINREEWGQAWTEVALQWLMKLRDELGGNYRVSESAHFFLLGGLDSTGTRRLLDFAEFAMEFIRDQLAEVAWRNFHGKHVILLFMDEDDYYQYRAPTLIEGMNMKSGGVFLSTGYAHVALPYYTAQATAGPVAHELTHNCLGHLPLPLWLNEGVAQRIEHQMTQPRFIMLDRQLANAHHDYWSQSTIQSFWAGTSFQDPTGRTLSYSLAEILVHQLADNHEQLLSFLQNAHYNDAGQTAALDCLGLDLGELAAGFLGTGDWRPQRKAMVDCWENRAAPNEKLEKQARGDRPA